MTNVYILKKETKFIEVQFNFLRMYFFATDSKKIPRLWWCC
jgi:hypothetical protein